MDKRTLTNLLLLILIILVLFGLYKITKKSKVLEPAVENKQEEQTGFDWAKLSSKELADIVSKNSQSSFDPSIPLKISEISDFTGDGVLEAVVVGYGINDEVYFILRHDSVIGPVLAEERELDGSISPASLIKVSRVKNIASFKLLPEEMGYYAVSQFFNEDEDRWMCGGVYAYKWNESSKLFELDANLSAKYTDEGCATPR